MYSPIARWKAKRAEEAEAGLQYDKFKREVTDWLKKYDKVHESTSDYRERLRALAALEDPPSRAQWMTQPNRVKVALNAIEEARLWVSRDNRKLEEQTHKVDGLERQSRLDDVFFGLRKYFEDYDSSLVPLIEVRIEKRLEELAPKVADILWARAEAGDQQAFRNLLLVIEEWIGKSNYVYPAMWDNVVAELFENPNLADFIPRPEQGPGEVRLMAVKALRERSVMHCKLVLAYCNADAETRAEVGDVLTADLAKLIDQAHASVNHPALTKKAN